MRATIFLLGAFFSVIVQAQSNSGENNYQKEIDEQVWKLFKKTFSSMDVEGFNSIHTDDVLRIGGGRIYLGEEYHKRNEMTFEMSRGIRERKIDFSFVERVARENVAYEVGYYRIVSVNLESDDRDTSTFYGRFHVVIKKIDGVWKIAQDWDTGSMAGRKISEDDFKSGDLLGD